MAGPPAQDVSHGARLYSHSMNIHVKFADDSPSAYPLEPFTLESNEIHLLPQIGDQVTNGMTPRVVKGRVFQFAKTEINVTLICS